MDNRKKTESQTDLEKKLNLFLKDNGKKCESEECLINEPEELVKREHKKIITNDGRQLLL